MLWKFIELETVSWIRRLIGSWEELINHGWTRWCSDLAPASVKKLPLFIAGLMGANASSPSGQGCSLDGHVLCSVPPVGSRSSPLSAAPTLCTRSTARSPLQRSSNSHWGVYREEQRYLSVRSAATHEIVYIIHKGEGSSCKTWFHNPPPSKTPTLFRYLFTLYKTLGFSVICAENYLWFAA